MRSSSILAFCVVAAHAILVLAFYEEKDGIELLTDEDFDSRVKKDSLWLIEFYAPWCGHCAGLVPLWKQAAKALKGIVNVGAVDATVSKDLASDFDVDGFPTIKFISYRKGRKKVVKYNKDERSAKAFVKWALVQTNKAALARIGAIRELDEDKKGKKKGKGEEEFYDAASGVTSLEPRQFQEDVVDGKLPWMVEFYAPWCGMCKNIKKQYVDFAANVEGKAKVGAVDCEAHTNLCQDYGADQYPTILYFGSDKANPEKFEDVLGTEGLTDFVVAKWKQLHPPGAKQLVSQRVFERECTGTEGFEAKKLCFIAFLPHILDSKAAGRQSYLQILRSLAERYEDRPFSFLWAEGNAQPHLETAFGVGGFGYPAFVALTPKETSFAKLRDSFDHDHCKQFIEQLRAGRQALQSVENSSGRILKTPTWDGKDGVPVAAEEIKLEDVIGGSKNEL